MTRQRVVMATAVLFMLGLCALASEGPVEAATCFADNGGLVYVLSVAGASEGFFSLVGEVVFGPTLSFPLTGSAHIRTDGNAHIAAFVHSALPGTLAPFAVQAVLNQPTFTTGTGTFANFAGGTGNLAFNAAPCPAVFPQ
jgi:hypothetical protein